MKNLNLLTTTWRAMAALALLYVFFAPSAFVSFGQTGYGTGYRQVWPDVPGGRIVREFALDFDWKTFYPDGPPPVDYYRASLEFELGRRFISVYGFVSSIGEDTSVRLTY